MEAASDPLSWDSIPSIPPSAMRAVKDITFGSIAGMVSKVFEHPFDLTKVRLQSQVLDTTARFNGPIDCLVKTWKNEGVRGLYRWLPCWRNASLFMSYSELQDVIRRINSQPLSYELSLPQLALAGAGAGAITSFLLQFTPVELVKCKMQVQMIAPKPLSVSIPESTAAATLDSTLGPVSRPLPGPIAVLMSVIRTEGLRGLWLGQTGTLIRECGGGASWFATKEFVGTTLIKRRGSELTRKDIVPWESALSGACAGGVFNFSMFPADSIKSTMQTEEDLRPRGSNAPKPTGFMLGVVLPVARSIPSSAIIFLIYDGLSSRFG
ncbi:mitochondrial carrier [Suillus subalutaceus]|uniref:mitochondrial carrier n=1 Tax=Suillus subalutaceus TaxID=48586 RepID=UPI001B87932F|nr:mitochondrial carrier [Suillus subalutaceus]KAG1846099.1 mitochondrial carrier [Suillus subalutaceus]